jgi:hypothetical protein
MPPNSESIGLALEDATLISWILDVHRGEPILRLLSMYEDLYQNTIHKAYKEAEARWDGVWDKGWLIANLLE